MTPMLPATEAMRDDGWSARGPIRTGLLTVLLLAGGIGGWAATAELSGAVIAVGALRVETQRQVVQHPDGGVVGEILVRDGTVVEGGDLLIRLDGTTLQSELAVLESQLFEMMARRGRLAAEETDRPEPSFDGELIEVAKTRPEVAALIDGQRALFAARRETLAREIDMMGERQTQIRDQIAGAEGEMAALVRQAELIADELKGQQQLYDQGLAQLTRVLSLEREAARLEGSRGQMAAQIAQLKGQIAEIGIEQLRLEASRREEAITESRELGFRELELQERRIALQEQLSRLDIRAPRAGVVYDMTVHALKSVIRPAEPVLYIVPNDTGLVVDAQVDPLDIDVLVPGQQATLRFSTFNARTTPELQGIVRQISADAFTEERTGRSYYRTEVILAPGELEKLEGQALVAGMPVEVFIQTGERTPFNYLMKPMADYFNKAFRED